MSTTTNLSGLDSSLKTASSSALKQSNSEVGKTEFLQLLVTQLKNQDPLNPMENQEFAVQLAQFSSLEQLVSINDKVGGSGADGMGSLASYLGHEIVLNSDKVQVENHDGGRLALNLAQDVSELRIDLLKPDGSVAESSTLGPLAKGKHSVELSDLTSANGEYKVKITATNMQGGTFNPDVYAAGIVSGFIPGPNPKLLMNGREVQTGDIREVRIPAM